jgi:peptide deformylase
LIRISDTDELGIVQEIEADGILGVCSQQEMDYLMGCLSLERFRYAFEDKTS